MAGAYLTIDLKRLVENYDLFRRAAPGAETGAVVKADAYGLGALEVGPALWSAGCRRFFVAHGSEGAALRSVLPQAEIFVFHGALLGEEADFMAARLVPVLSSPEQLARWAGFAASSGYRDCALQVDTGMNRLGFGAREFSALCSSPEILNGLDVRLVMSHLVSADEREAPLNPQQLAAFKEMMEARPEVIGRVPLSFANSAGVLLGAHYQFDLTRVGIGLYGGNPFSGVENPVQAVVKLEADILQVREIAAGETVSYGATFKATRPSRIATIGVGYADGYLRQGGGAAYVMMKGQKAPVVGRVTMDLIMIDVTDVPVAACQPGAMVELLNDELTVDDMAEWSGTIGYEVLTALGGRYERRYIRP